MWAVIRSWCLMLGLGVAGLHAEEHAGIPDPGVEGSGLPRHPLEIRALVEPELVLKRLPGEIAAARASGDRRQLALLYLAEANACRVIADWLCQRNAGVNASEAAQSAGDSVLLMRALIAESRASIALKDFTKGERLLGEAELHLVKTPSPEIAADIFLAYSSLSFTLGNHVRSADYAHRGLLQLGAGDGLAMQARLLRNQARALAQLGQSAEANKSLARGIAFAKSINDPKLMGELYLEVARVARLDKDPRTMRENGLKVIELSQQLKNTQLEGQGHEVLGQAAVVAGDRRGALLEFQTAYASFQNLGLDRDELRLARDLISVLIDADEPPLNLAALVRRFLELDVAVRESDRLQAADDFEARLKYAQQELDLVRLEGEATLARERERALTETNRLTGFLVLLALGIVVVLTVFFVQQRRSTKRLSTAFAALNESEARAMDLLRESRGFVFLHDPQGMLLMVNPAAAEVLGGTPESLLGRSLAEFITQSAVPDFQEYLQRVMHARQDEGTLLVRALDGTHRHWRYSSRLSLPAKTRPYVIGQAVDVSDQVQQTAALREQNVRDALTGAYNRRHIEEFERRHPESSWGVINIDLDHFKQINDTLGHDRGDEVLIGIARFLEERVRDGGAVVRAGGDEFVLLLLDANEASLRVLVERLNHDAVGAPCAFSLGAALREGVEPLAKTLARADAGMYNARRSVRGAAPAGKATLN